MDSTQHSGALAEEFRVLGDRLIRTHDGPAALQQLVHLATQTIPFCDWAGITQVSGRGRDRFATIAATDPVVRVADDLQYDSRDGPCVDAAGVDGVFQAPDLRISRDWPAFGQQVTTRTPIRSVLSLTLHPAPVRAAINLYSSKVNVFTDDAIDAATLFAAHAQVLLMLARQTDKIENLDRALTTSRLIGYAVGILMSAHSITSDEAFARLRAASSHLNRKLTDIAEEVTETGALPADPHRHPSLSPPQH